MMDILPADAFHDHEERVDSRDTNSWLLKLDAVSAPEMLEVQLVNNIAPFLLNSRCKPLLLRSPFARRFIVNVSAMEGQFQRHKTVYHPHTNMAKGRAEHDDAHQWRRLRPRQHLYEQRGYRLGHGREPHAQANAQSGRRRLLFAPLDIYDGMARIYHPIAEGINDSKEPYYGVFLKDYAPCPW